MYKITNTRSSVVILHSRRCIDCLTGLWFALINVATDTHPRFVENLKEMSSYRPRSTGQYRPSYFRVTIPFRIDIVST